MGNKTNNHYNLCIFLPSELSLISMPQDVALLATSMLIYSLVPYFWNLAHSHHNYVT